ncbi:hypothetical protein T01_6462, partial [Trichinella spiralis]
LHAITLIYPLRLYLPAFHLPVRCSLILVPVFYAIRSLVLLMEIVKEKKF